MRTRPRNWPRWPARDWTTFGSGNVRANDQQAIAVWPRTKATKINRRRLAAPRHAAWVKARSGAGRHCAATAALFSLRNAAAIVAKIFRHFRRNGWRSRKAGAIGVRLIWGIGAKRVAPDGGAPVGSSLNKSSMSFETPPIDSACKSLLLMVRVGSSMFQ